jgi:predicted NBD/HSP70 family sugar kinase
VGVVLGTGVGGALAAAGRVWTGPRGLAGEWGHQPPPRETDANALAVPCGCGRRGCIDALLGGRGWLWAARERGLPIDTPEAAVAALRSGHAAARAAQADYRDRLARALALWADLLDPDCILLGGGLAEVPELTGELEPLVAGARYGSTSAPRIGPGRLGTAAPAIGAALVAAGIGTG